MTLKNIPGIPKNHRQAENRANTGFLQASRYSDFKHLSHDLINS